MILQIIGENAMAEDPAAPKTYTAPVEPHERPNLEVRKAKLYSAFPFLIAF